MFQLQVPESDESEDTLRAAHARLFRWSVRIVTYVAMWATFNSLSPRAAPRLDRGDANARYRFTASTHAWCDPATGRCGVHDTRHRPVSVSIAP